MCLAIPARISAIDLATDSGLVTLGGVTKEVSLALIEAPSVGDYVLVHVGYALSKIDPKEATQTLALMREMGVALESSEATDMTPR